MYIFNIQHSDHLRQPLNPHLSSLMYHFGRETFWWNNHDQWLPSELVLNGERHTLYSPGIHSRAAPFCDESNWGEHFLAHVGDHLLWWWIIVFLPLIKSFFYWTVFCHLAGDSSKAIDSGFRCMSWRSRTGEDGDELRTAYRWTAGLNPEPFVRESIMPTTFRPHTA